MGILSQQALAGARAAGESTPFPKPPEWETAKSGFGGFRYAKNTDQRVLFSVAATRQGPTDIIANDPVYGGSNGARPGLDGTVLGQLAMMMHFGINEWADKPAARQIGHSIMSSGELRSLRDTTLTPTDNPDRPIYRASGGAFAGYQSNNEYGVSNWMSADKINVGSNRQATQEELSAANAESGQGAAQALAQSGVDEVTGRELFRATDDITTGLRSLPVSPTA